MKKLNPVLKRILLIFISVILLLLTIWLGYSFFSMTSSTPHLKTEIDLSEDVLAQHVVSDLSEEEEYVYIETNLDQTISEKEPEPLLKDGNYIFYKYAIRIYDISFGKEDYIISAYAMKHWENFESLESSKFEYSLPKDKGNFDFSQLEHEQPINLLLKYRVDNNLKYFIEYSMCTLKDFMGIENSYGDSKCVIERDFINWEIEIN